MERSGNFVIVEDSTGRIVLALVYGMRHAYTKQQEFGKNAFGIRILLCSNTCEIEDGLKTSAVLLTFDAVANNSALDNDLKRLCENCCC